MTKERLMAFAKAWSKKDLDATLDFFTEDCVYIPSVGGSNKKSYLGKDEVRTAIKKIMLYDNTISSSVKNTVIDGDFGFWEWEYLTRNEDRIFGCDVFKFRGNRILEKNAYRKI